MSSSDNTAAAEDPEPDNILNEILTEEMDDLDHHVNDNDDEEKPEDQTVKAEEKSNGNDNEADGDTKKDEDVLSNFSSSEDDDDDDEDDEEPKVSLSVSSLSSFGSQPELSGDIKLSPVDKHQKKKEYRKCLEYILKEARFYLIKSGNTENIDLSKSRGVWSTLPTNENKINHSLTEKRNVFLIFSVQRSGKFAGFARVISPSIPSSSSNTDKEGINWILPPGLPQTALGGLFNIDWVSKNDLLFTSTHHLYNRWNKGKPVKIGRDGQEIEPHVGSELCRLFPVDYETDVELLTKKSKESEEKLTASGVSGVGQRKNSGSGSNYTPFRSRGPRPSSRANYGYKGQSQSYSSSYYPMTMRKTESRYHPYSSRSRSSSSYGQGQGREGQGQGRRYSDSENYRRSSYSSSSYSGRKESDKREGDRKSSSSTSKYYYENDYDYYKYEEREFRTPRPPPPSHSYPPPPPFDNLPPPLRYYEGLPLPDLSTLSSSTSTSRSYRSEALRDFEYYRRADY